METSWSDQTALIVYFMAAFYSGCDSLSLSVCSQVVFCQLLGHFFFLYNSFLVDFCFYPSFCEKLHSFFDFTHKTEQWRCVCVCVLALYPFMWGPLWVWKFRTLIQSLVMVYNCLGHLCSVNSVISTSLIQLSLPSFPVTSPLSLSKWCVFSYPVQSALRLQWCCGSCWMLCSCKCQSHRQWHSWWSDYCPPAERTSYSCRERGRVSDFSFYVFGLSSDYFN